MKNIFLLIMTISSVIGAIYIFGTKPVNAIYERPPYIAMADRIIGEVGKKLTKRYNMKIRGITTGMADCVNVIGYSFQIKGPLTKERLREIVVGCVEELLSSINSDEEIRPFLKNYPFTAKEIRIAIFIVDKQAEDLYYPEIMLAAQYRGEMYYKTIDINNKLDYKTVEEEDYDTALQIVRNNKH